MGRLLPRSLWDSRNPPAIPHHDERQSREYPYPSASARPPRLGDWPRSGADGGISMLSRCHAGPTPAKMRFSYNSPLEEAGFEPPVPPGKSVAFSRRRERRGPTGWSRKLASPLRGTSSSNSCTLQSGYWLVGIVDWPNRAGLPGVARESCVLSTWNGPAPRQVGRDGSPVGGCASSASTGIDARRGGPDVSDARGV